MPLYLQPDSHYETRPIDNGLDAWTSPLWQIGGSAFTPTAGVGYYHRVLVPDRFTITNLHYRVTTAASSQIANAFVGVFNSAGTRLGVSATQATAMQSTGYKTAAITVDGGQSLTVGGTSTDYIWAAVVIGTQGTTAAQLRADYSADQNNANLNLTASSPYFMGSLGTGLSALPSSITASSMASAISPWFGVT